MGSVHADESSIVELAVSAYRAKNLRGRAIYGYTLSASGSRSRRATCIFCRQLIATCSAAHRITKGYLKAIDDHVIICAERYLTTTHEEQ